MQGTFPTLNANWLKAIDPLLNPNWVKGVVLPAIGQGHPRMGPMAEPAGPRHVPYVSTQKLRQTIRQQSPKKTKNGQVST